ncbi:MAG: bifunctional N-acetylglucosamine-1-phosphate uridyltransferase/glucosamine-1-phosphate acetyltransferase [Phycisphaerae bacterium]
MADGSTGQSTAGGSGRALAAVILAAGRSTRMKTDLPKVMHELCGRPMLAYVLDACRAAGISTMYVVVGFGHAAIRAAFGREPDVRFVTQSEQKGTGHAVMMCEAELDGFSGDVVVIAGDMPLVRPETLRDLVDGHRATGSAASLATTILDDPTSYGRIVRDASGEFERIVEHRDCDAEQLTLHEVNPSYYCFDWQALRGALDRISPDNAKGEFYLTDALAILRSDGGTVRASTVVPAADAVGINSRVDLAAVGRLMQQRIQTRWMEDGVTIVAPESTWIDSRARIGRETVIRPFSCIEGRATIGSGCSIGPYAFVQDGAVVEDGAAVGPGALSAFDATTRQGGRSRNGNGGEKTPVVRRPPAQAGC